MIRTRTLRLPIALLAIALANTAVFAEVEHIYIATDQDARIVRVDADGNNPIEIVQAQPNTRIEAFHGDPVAEKIYWMGGLNFIDDTVVHTLWRANLDGTRAWRRSWKTSNWRISIL